jgi:predicted nucleotidyltransferase
MDMKPARSLAPNKYITTTEDPEAAERFNRILKETVEALEASGIRYAFIGGIASGGLGRPRSTHDIDVFVRPEDAESALRALAKKNFRTEKTDPAWLYKGFKENILVDVIFKSKGEIYLDSEMYQRLTVAEFHGLQLRLVAPEDLVIIKAAAHSELTPGHWHDALALLSHPDLDWGYLVRRARRAPRRVLSLFLYAQSSDIWVPNQAIHDLYRVLFTDSTAEVSSLMTPKAKPRSTSPSLRPVPSEIYAAAHLRESLARDPRTNELDIQIEQAEGKLLLRGEVPTSERRDAAIQVARETFPASVIENQIRVISFPGPAEAEEVK